MSQSENPASNQATDSTKAPTKCVGGCGFWGDPSRKNCCSVCFKKMYPDEAQAEADALQNGKATQSAVSNQNGNASPNDTESKEDPNDANVSNPEEAPKPKKKRKIQKKKHKCWVCKKKMTLAGQFACQCGYTFCAQHRYPDSHQCDIDFKKKHQENLAKNNQVIAFKKVEEI